MNTYPGILIAIDGIDGAGKTTQVNLLESALVGIGETVVVSKEPTAGHWGQKLRDSARTGRLPFEEELESFIRDRQEHLEQKIIPALEAGNVVILDRYFYSTIAYQGILLEDYKTIEERIRADVIVPDAAYWMDLPADIAVGRVTSRDGQPNLFERQDDLAKAGEIFRAISTIDRRLHKVDATLSVQSIHRMIVEELVSNALKLKRCAKSYGCDDPYYCTPRITGSCGWWNVKQKLSA
jgi:dTMP kinase